MIPGASPQQIEEAPMGQPATKIGHFTYGDYCSWPDDERWELIDGVAYAMSLAPSRGHQELVMELGTQIRVFLRGKPCRVYAAPFDVRLPSQDEADPQTRTVVQPDLAVICDQTKLDTKGCRGAPDWIIEILSPRTAAKDWIQKRRAYERHGVREYWLVHPVDRLLTIYRRDGDRFGTPEIQVTEGTTVVGVLEGLVIDWNAVEWSDQHERLG
jgi:Uma2 family endonuclease